MAIRRTQIFWNFQDRQGRTLDNGQNVPKNGPIPAQAQIPIFGPILLCNTANMGFFGVASSFMTFVTTFNYAFSPYPVYPVSILGVFCWYPNFGPIELYFMANMGFFGVENYFLTFITTIE